MRRPVIMGGNPYILDYYRKNAKELFDETGGNSGNLAFMYGVTSHLIDAPHLHFGAPIEHVKKIADVIVLPLANQLGQHTDLGSVADRLHAFNLPIIGLGLGAQTTDQSLDITLTRGTERWLQLLGERAPTNGPNIGVRGEYTRRQIALLGFNNKVAVTGCPSNFINTTDDIAASVAKGFKRRPRHIAVAAGIPFIPKLARIEQDLVDMVTLTGGAYIVQHGLQMLQLARNEFDSMSVQDLDTCREYICPNYTTEEFKTWCRTYAYCFYDVRGWMDYIRRFDFVIGTRFHGAMLAIQAGVPAACIAHDSRTLEMCETMGIPVRSYKDFSGGLTVNNVFDYFSFDAEHFNATRKELCSRYLSIFDEADIGVHPSLRRLLNVN